MGTPNIQHAVPRPLTLRKIVILTTAGGFLDGYSIIMMSAALLLLIPAFKMTAATTGLLASVVFIGMALGALIAGPITDKFGRRIVFMVDIALFFVLSVMFALSQSLVEIIVLRFLVGVAVGADMPTSTSMLAEFGPQRLRGALTSAMNTVWVFGFVVAGLVGYLLYQTTGPSAWRWMFLSAAAPALVVFILRRDVPETAYWLRSAGRIEQAEQVEARLQYLTDAERLAIRTATPHERGRYRDLTRDGNWKSVGFFTAYWFLQSLAGATLLIYTAVIFTKVIKFSGANALLFSDFLSVLYVIGMILVTLYVIDRSGRKTLAAWTLLAATVGAIGVAFLRGNPGFLVLIYAAAIIASQLAVQPFWPWSVELLPTKIRATGQSIGTAGGKIGGFLGILLFPAYLAHVGWTASLLTIAGVNFLAFLLVVLVGKETKNVNLSDLELPRSQSPLT